MDAAHLDAAHVRTIARLARLHLTDEQVEQHRVRLGAVLDYVQRLNRLVAAVGSATLPGSADAMESGVPEALGRLEADTPGPTLGHAQALGLAPDVMGPFYRVPRVTEEGA